MLKKIGNKISYLVASLVLLTAQLTPFFVSVPKAGATVNDKVRICHAPSSSSNQYTSNSVSADAIDGNGNSSSDHNRNDHQNGEDIIPPFYENGNTGNWTARNWDAEGEAIWRNNCNASGSIKIIKDTQPDTEKDFDFNINQDGQGGLYNNFELEDDGNNNDNKRNYKTFDNLTSDTYVITEDYDGDWSLKGITCTGVEYTVDLQDRKVTVNLGATQNAVCIFVNIPKPAFGSVKVDKKVDTDSNGSYDGGNSTANSLGFKWGLDNEQVNNDMGTEQSDVTVGAHSVYENTVPGYTFTGWYYTDNYDDRGDHQENCNYPRGTTLPVNITVEKNNTKEITLCNKKIPNGYVKVVKNVVNDNGGNKTYADFTFKNNLETSYTFLPTTLPDGERVLTLPVGSNFSITETEANANGYKTSYSGSCSGAVTSTVKICTITNDDEAPTLEVGKRVINDNGGTVMSYEFDLYVNGVLLTDDRRGGGDVSDNGVWYLHGNTKANTIYTITEDEVNGYSKTSLVCTDIDTQLTVSHPITLSLGQRISCTITNNDKPVTITATKIVCDNESLLPNYGNGGPNITSQTAIDWVTNNSGCKLAEGWNFEYAFNNASNPGDSQEVGGAGWTVFGQTGANGQASAEVNDIYDVNKIWVREQLKEGYLGFTFNTPGGNNNTVSAEIYCNEDVLNYDNYDFIDNPMYGNTYYCVAWNVEQKGRVEVTKFNDANNNGIWDSGEVTIPGWDMELTPLEECIIYALSENEDEESVYECDEPETITQETNEAGVAIFSNVESGWYTVGEDEEAGWDQTVIYCDDEEYASRISESQNTKNIYVGAGQTVKCVIGNYDTPGGGGNGGEEKGTIVVTKFNDMNNNKIKDAGEPNMQGWEIVIEGQGVKLTKTTGADGTVTFTDLKLGSYKVSEILQDGWVQTVNYCEDNTSQEECVVGGEPVNCYIGNYKKPSTPGVLGVSTPTPKPVVLASTGHNTTFETLVGMFLIGGALLVTVSQRKTVPKTHF